MLKSGGENWLIHHLCGLPEGPAGVKDLTSNMVIRKTRAWWRERQGWLLCGGRGSRVRVMVAEGRRDSCLQWCGPWLVVHFLEDGPISVRIWMVPPGLR